MSSSEAEYDDNEAEYTDEGLEQEVGDSNGVDYEDPQADLMDDGNDTDEPNNEYKVTAWGKKKEQYYNEEEGKESDEEAEFEEEEEAKLIEGQQKDRLTEGEFFDVFLSKKKTFGDEKLEDDDETNIFDPKRLKEIQKLEDYEKHELLKKESPELISIINEFRRHLKEIKYKYHPLHSHLRLHGSKLVEGKKYVDAKYELLLSYCMSLAFYITLKREGKSVKDHPILKQLVNIKAQLASLKSIDKSLEPQIGSLLRKIESEQVGPEVKNSLQKIGRTGKQQKPAKIKSEKHQNLTNLYRNNESSSLSLKEKLQKTNKKKKNALASLKSSKNIMATDGDSSQDYDDDDHDEEEAQRLQFAKIGLKVPLKQKKKSMGNLSRKNGDIEPTFEEFDDDFGFEDDFGPEDGFAMDDDLELKNSQASKPKTVSDYLKKKKYREMRKTEDEDDLEGDELYKKMKSDKTNRKIKMQNEKQKIHDAQFDYDNDYVDGDEGVRRISNTILKNRGLTRRRKKEDKNARVKHRNKYEAALKKLKSKGVTQRDKSRGYEGELTGIKAGIIRSTALRK